MAFHATSYVRNWTAILLCALFGIAPPSSASQTRTKHRIQLIPHYSSGEVLRYSIQFRGKTTAKAIGPIVDPDGASQSEQSISMILRLEVISVDPSRNGVARMRATYEKVAANGKSNSYDPNAAALEKQYDSLEGRSIEFSLHPDGRISDVAGLEDIVKDPARAAAVNQWLSQITLGASTPRREITAGEKWSSQQPVAGAPLDGLVWRAKSTYQGDEPCAVPGTKPDSADGAANAANSVSAPQVCAMILTRSETRHAKRGDSTPEAYKKSGLRTSGEWKGTGETLTGISLRTGIVMSVTQSSTTHMDVTITAVATGNSVRYTDDTQSEAQITLLPEPISLKPGSPSSSRPNQLQ